MKTRSPFHTENMEVTVHGLHSILENIVKLKDLAELFVLQIIWLV